MHIYDSVPRPSSRWRHILGKLVVTQLLVLPAPCHGEQTTEDSRSVYAEPLTRTELGHPCDVSAYVIDVINYYNTGDWPFLQGELKRLLVRCAATNHELPVDPEATYSFLFIDRPSKDKTASFPPTPARVLVQPGRTPSRYSLRASGRPLYDIQLLPKPPDPSPSDTPKVLATTY